MVQNNGTAGARLSLRRRSLTIVSGVLLLGAIGCGNGLATVSGNVTLNGSPLACGDNTRGTVYFFPEGGTGAPAVGLLDQDGAYQVSTGSQAGVQPGDYVVTVSASELIPPRVAGEAPGGRAITPRRYADPSSSGFRVSVAPGDNEFDFALEGEPGRPNTRRR